MLWWLESVWSVSKLLTESVGSRRELVVNCVQTADADATKHFRRVGGVYWASASCCLPGLARSRRSDASVLGRHRVVHERHAGSAGAAVGRHQQGAGEDCQPRALREPGTTLPAQWTQVCTRSSGRAQRGVSSGQRRTDRQHPLPRRGLCILIPLSHSYSLLLSLRLEWYNVSLLHECSHACCNCTSPQLVRQWNKCVKLLSLVG